MASPATQHSDVIPARNDEADRVGTTLARAGVLALLAGAAFAFKHAIERGLIGPGARVAVGLVTGAALIAYGERARRKGWLPLAGALTGGGAAMLYLSVLVAGETFHLIDRPVMFAGLIGVTLATGWLAMRHDSQPLAVLGALGALANPLLLMNAAEHEGVMSYLIALDAAALLLYARRWIAFEVVLFAGSAFIFAAASQHVVFATAVIYATALVAIATAPAFLRRESEAHLVSPQMTAGFAFLAFLVDGTDGRIERTAATLIVAVSYGTLALLARRLGSVVLMTAMAAVGYSASVLALMFAFGGRGALAAWSVQGCALLWFGLRSGYGMPVTIGFAQFAISTLNGLVALSQHSPERGFTSPDAAAFAVQIGCVWFMARHAPRSKEFAQMGAALRGSAHAYALVWIAIEIFPAFGRGQAGGMAISCAWALYAAGVIAYGVRADHAEARWTGVGVFAIVATKLALYDLWLLEGMYRSIAFLAAGVVLIGSGIAYQRLRTFGGGRAAV